MGRLGLVRFSSFNQRVTFQKLVEAQTVSGDPVQTWVDYITVWASVSVVPGQIAETFRTMHHFTNQLLEVKCRYIPRVTPRMRMLHREIALNILTVDDKDTRGKQLSIMAHEKT
jgi:SPP1 family predicted phage head-tail adaptor